MIIPFGDFTPDTPDLKMDGAQECTLAYGCLPKSKDSYAPLGSMTMISTALNARAQGAMPAVDSSGNTYLFAGNATKLYKFDSSGKTPTDVSKVGGYATTSEEQWKGVQIGQRVVMTNYADAIQSYVLDSSSVFADLAATAPKAKYMAVAKNFLVVGNTVDGTFGTQPQRIWWSALGDPTSWPTPGTSGAAAVQSDYQDLYGDGGSVQGLVGGLAAADFAVFLEKQVYRAQYIGSPAVFQIDAVEGARGTPAPGSIAQLGSLVFYLGGDGFYAFDGLNSVPIGFQKIDKFFYTDVDQSFMSRITSTIDPINKIYAVAYPRGGFNGLVSRVLFYNWGLQRWSYADFNLEILFRSLSLGYSLEDLDAVSPSLDDLTTSLDSRVWTGGRLILSAFDQSHKLNYFTGPAVEAQIATSEFQLPNGQRMQVHGARPLVDGGVPTVQFGYRDNQTDSVSYTAASSPGRAGFCPGRADARFVRAKMTIASGGTWTHAMGLDADFRPSTNA